MSTGVDQQDLIARVKAMYRRVAHEPHGEFHFEMGRSLAERLGYPSADLDRVPAEAVDSFAGVGYHFRLADISRGSRVLDLGSGSGMDAFFAALRTGPDGAVVGIDMTAEQRAKAEKLARRSDFSNVSFVDGYLESLPFDDASFDTLISNGVINLCADKGQVFREIARVLRPGGSLILSDIVTETTLPESITCNSTLWAACIGGAMQQDSYRSLISAAGLDVERIEDTPEYRFLSKDALGASQQYGVKSISLLARKPAGGEL